MNPLNPASYLIMQTNKGTPMRTERRKTMREALEVERPWWASKMILDEEMRRRLDEQDGSFFLRGHVLREEK